jgi:hypothetical protein
MKTTFSLRTFTLLAAAATFLTVFSKANGQTYFFDFGSNQGTSNDPSGNVWNTVSNSVMFTNDQIFGGVFDSTGMFSTLQIEMVSRFNGENLNGTEASTLFPPTATRDSLYGNTEAFNNLSNVTPKFRITGLDPALTYNFTFYASRGQGVTDNRTTDYVLTGSAAGTTSLNVANNVENFGFIGGAAPKPTVGTGTGEFLVELFPGAANNNANHFIYLGALKVEAIPEPSSALMIASGVAILAFRRRRIAA